MDLLGPRGCLGVEILRQTSLVCLGMTLRAIVQTSTSRRSPNDGMTGSRKRACQIHGRQGAGKRLLDCRICGSRKQLSLKEGNWQLKSP